MTVVLDPHPEVIPEKTSRILSRWVEYLLHSQEATWKKELLFFHHLKDATKCWLETMIVTFKPLSVENNLSPN